MTTLPGVRRQRARPASHQPGGATADRVHAGAGEHSVRDVDDLRDLKRRYMELVRIYGEEATEFKPFKESLLELNRRHRLEAIRLYVKVISKIEKKRGGGRGR
jgi:hypothetical protein